MPNNSLRYSNPIALLYFTTTYLSWYSYTRRVTRPHQICWVGMSIKTRWLFVFKRLKSRQNIIASAWYWAQRNNQRRNEKLCRNKMPSFRVSVMTCWKYPILGKFNRHLRFHKIELTGSCNIYSIQIVHQNGLLFSEIIF